MARFVFRLQGVMRQRKLAEQEKQRALAVHQARLNALGEELRQLERSLRAASDDVRNHRLVGVLDLQFLAAHRRFLGAMQKRGMTILQRVALAKRDLDEARVALAQAARETKVIEKLRQRQHDRWRADQERREMIEMDEVGMQLGFAAIRGDGEQTS
ncbi:MAG: flagellar export protein FliJ [Tepidisphaeraceae bacterium]